jgi:hypothetical protein
MRLSPDGMNLAIRNRDDRWFPWRVTDGSQRSDQQVADWHPIPSVTATPEQAVDTTRAEARSITYIPPGVTAIVSPGITAWTADEGGFFIGRDPAGLPSEEDVLARIEHWLVNTYGDDHEDGLPALAEELLRVVDGTEPYVCEHCGRTIAANGAGHVPGCPEE